jgi:peptide/nickel transport system ATP-binding protein
MEQNNSLLNVKDLVKHFDISGGLLDQLAMESGRVVRKKTTVKAVNAVSFAIMPQETGGGKRLRKIDSGQSRSGIVST